MKNDKPASGRLEVPRRHSGKTLEAPIRGGSLLPAPRAMEAARVSEPARVPTPLRPPAPTPSRPRADTTTRMTVSAPPSRARSRPSNSTTTPRPSRAPQSLNQGQQEPQFLDDVQRQLDDFKHRIERGELGTMEIFSPVFLAIAGCILAVAILFSFLMGGVIWAMLGIFAWSLSNVADKFAKVGAGDGRPTSEGGKAMTDLLGSLHPSWSNPATIRLHLRALAIVCGVIWIGTSFIH